MQKEIQKEDVMTYDEILEATFRPKAREGFPDDSKYLGDLLGSLIDNPKMIEINKLIVDSVIKEYTKKFPEMFSREVANKLDVRFILSITYANNKNYNDLLAYLIRAYIGQVNDMEK